MAFLQRNTVNDHLSPSLFASKPDAVGKTKSLGRHAASARATGEANQRKTAQLFFVAASLCEAHPRLRYSYCTSVVHRGDGYSNRRKIAASFLRDATAI